MNWQTYYDAAKKCHDLAAELRTADKPVHDAVKGRCTGMAGDAPGCKQWGETYDERARTVLQTCTNLADALTNFGYLLYATGYNHGVANKSNPDRPQVADVTVHSVQIPSSVADNGNGLGHQGGAAEFFDSLLDKVTAELGKLPNGDLDKLATAETVWKTFGNHETVTGAAARISAIADLLTGIDEPQTRQGIANDFATMRTAAESLADAAQVMAAPIGEYRTNTEETSRQISSETTTFLVESGIIIAAAVAVSWLTVGGSLAAGTTGIVALAGDTALTISRIYRASRLWALLGLAGAAAAVVAFDKIPDLTQVTTSLAAIIAARAYLDTEAEGPAGTDGTSTSDRPTKTDKIKEHLTDRDLDAARRELNGEVVARKPDGTPWDHVREVRDAQNGLVKRIDQIKRQLGDSRTNPADRAELERELSEASRLLDYSEQFVPRG
ncbi:polymorphic toxin type 28 domain-containing protein [Nocardia grenadensis]|uniref:polymorphic toxin type 28 domain-containing protein n=1 Tax=Nocardia grenadensis TaxID=931537 RepID=UPI001FE03433|nr:polymorphic toxin type 28 domain-containing protein [Nocardia grenadensis]